MITDRTPTIPRRLAALLGIALLMLLGACTASSTGLEIADAESEPATTTTAARATQTPEVSSAASTTTDTAPVAATGPRNRAAIEEMLAPHLDCTFEDNLQGPFAAVTIDSFSCMTGRTFFKAFQFDEPLNLDIAAGALRAANHGASPETCSVSTSSQDWLFEIRTFGDPFPPGLLDTLLEDLGGVGQDLCDLAVPEPDVATLMVPLIATEKCVADFGATAAELVDAAVGTVEPEGQPVPTAGFVCRRAGDSGTTFLRFASVDQATQWADAVGALMADDPNCSAVGVVERFVVLPRHPDGISNANALVVLYIDLVDGLYPAELVQSCGAPKPEIAAPPTVPPQPTFTIPRPSTVSNLTAAQWTQFFEGLTGCTTEPPFPAGSMAGVLDDSFLCSTSDALVVALSTESELEAGALAEAIRTTNQPNSCTPTLRHGTWVLTAGGRARDAAVEQRVLDEVVATHAAVVYDSCNLVSPTITVNELVGAWQSAGGCQALAADTPSDLARKGGLSGTVAPTNGFVCSVGEGAGQGIAHVHFDQQADAREWAQHPAGDVPCRPTAVVQNWVLSPYLPMELFTMDQSTFEAGIAAIAGAEMVVRC